MSTVADRAVAHRPHDYRSSAQPIWCPGCGDYGVLNCLLEAFLIVGRPPHEIAIVSGIGCSSRLPAYTKCYGFHGVHGRALPFSVGLKMVRPDLEVVAVGGDGDGYSIGGNHFMHACRRNIDMLYLVMDNRVYGMTKGQPSPTTEGDWDSQIAPGGTGLPSFNPLAVGLAAGANFVARGYVGDPIGLTNLIVEGMQFKGFAFLEVLSPCAIFRPEEIGWKARAHSRKKPPSADRASAIADALNEDELGLGVFFCREQAIDVKREKSTLTLADIERSFEI
jgi:2-oxoglutarate ferredoxin oxidoreductase subunit beta